MKDNKKFEFVLYINGNIICQRYFSIRDYNENVINSIDIYECSKRVVGMIESDLKEKSEEYMWSNYNPYEVQQEPKTVDDKDDNFSFEIKVSGKSVMRQIFSGNPYPQRVRYSVDVRSLVPKIIKEIQYTFSSENLTVEYCGIEL
jgi:hypothetical protein